MEKKKKKKNSGGGGDGMRVGYIKKYRRRRGGVRERENF
jgi:hypothetical protein